MGRIIPIILIFMSFVALIIMIIIKKRNVSKSEEQLNSAELTANEFINVKDIRDRFLYTRDGFIISYIKINPISIDLYSDNEKEQICRVLTAELSSIQKPFKFLAVSRPVDISPLITEYSRLLSETTDQMQKSLLRSEMMVMSNYATSGDVVERQFYIMLWKKYKQGIEQDLLKEVYEFTSKFEASNIMCQIIKEQEIIRLCNLVNNPAYVHLDN